LSRELRWNLGVALVVGVVLAASPHTSSARLPVKLAGGAAAAVGAYLLGLGARLFPTRPATAGRLGAGRAPASALLALAVLALAFVPTEIFLVGQWTTNIWLNGHGVLLPFVIGYLVWRILSRDTDPAPESSAWGWLFVAAALALAVLDSGIGTRFIAAAGFIVLLPGVSLLLLGRRRTRALALPLTLCAFLLPLPTILGAELGLLDASADGVAWVLRRAGLPTLREGPVVLVSNSAYSIGYNCTGFSFVYGGYAAAVLFAWTARSPARKVALLLLPWPVAVFWNIVRLSALITLSVTVDPHLVHSFIHGLSGIAAFWMCMITLYAAADREGLRRAFT
jgi:exosortase